MVPKSVGQVLTGATVRLKGYRDATVDGIKAKICMKMGIFEKTLCELYLLHLNVFLRLIFMSDWGILLLRSIIKQEEYKFIPWPVLIAHDK